MRSLVNTAAVMLLALSLSSVSLATNLVVNGGFEDDSPPLDSWTVLQGATAGLWIDYNFPHTGAIDAYFSATHNSHDSLEQMIPTTSGSMYEVSFWLSNPWSNPQDNDISVSWNGTQMLSLVNVPTSAYTLYSFSASAVGAQCALRFTGRDQGASLHLDDVSVTLVPEPSSMVLLGLAALILLALRRRRAA